MIRVRVVAFLVVFGAGCGSMASSPAVAPVTEASSTTAQPAERAEPAKPADSSWLDTFGTEQVAPAIPAGWRVMDVGAVRFAVPPNWTAPFSLSCAIGPSDGVVLLAFLASPESCGPAPDIARRLVIDASAGPPPTTPPDARVGQFDAWRLPDTTDPVGIDDRLANGIDVSVAAADAQQILDTFGESGARRALETGPTLSTTDWQPVTVDRVSVLVPPSWPLFDLPTQNIADGFFPDPGTCAYGWFVDVPRAITGHAANFAVSCAVSLGRPVDPADGVWVRELRTDETVGGTVVAHGTVDGLDVSVIDRALPDVDTVSPMIDLLVGTGTHVVRISIGVGLDPAIARAIVHSLHAA
ncbi:MAG TPA: hypothetical protein VGC84_11740 [Ilumatobacteraceae bacterium]